MSNLRNFKKRIIQIILLSLLCTLFASVWISSEYYTASEEYSDYYYKKLNHSIRQSNLARKLVEHLVGGMNLTIKLTEKLKSKTYFGDLSENFKGIKHNIPHLNITFGSVFMELSDIKKSTMNIFFIESKCATDYITVSHNNSTGDFILTARQCCSIESAAKINPLRDIYILHTCVVSDDFLLRAPKYVQKLLLNHVNVHVVRYNMTEMFSGTPVQELWRSGRWKETRFPVEHSSDVLRFTLLWKFGGMYCDLDVITLKPVDQLHSNFCGLESNDLIGSAILNFEPFGHGHDMLTEALWHLNNHFDGEKWAGNGPDVVTSLIMLECNTSVIQDLLNCSSFKVYDRDILYPLYWKYRKKLFENNLDEDIISKIKENSFTIHLWNKFTHKYKIQVGSTQGYGLLAKEFCPDVYFNCGESF